jgi:hypothetical protein
MPVRAAALFLSAAQYRKEKNMKKDMNLKTHSTISMLFSWIALLATVLPGAVGARPMRAPDTKGPYGFTTAALTFNGQRLTARLILRNKTDEPVQVRLQFVDKEGKVLVRRDATVHHGEDATLEFASQNGTGGVAITELRAQFGTSVKRSIGLLQPTLQIMDGENGKTVKTIGPEGFAEFKPVFNPPLAEAGPGAGPHE